MNKVMIVDDDEEFLNEITVSLKTAGYNTVVLSRTEKVVEVASREKPDIILMDLKIEGGSGFEAAGRLRRAPATGHIPMLAITGFYTEKEYQLATNACGFTDCLIKPLGPLDIIEAIEKALAR